MKRNGALSSFWQKKQYIIAGTLVVVAAVGMTALYGGQEKEEIGQQELAAETDTEELAEAVPQETEAEAASSVVQPEESGGQTAQTDAQAVAETDTDAQDDAGTQEAGAAAGASAQAAETDADTNAQTVAQTADTLHFAAEDGLLWPMEGNVILDYSMDSTVYFATLDQYKYNPAVIIAGDVNSKVYSVAKGKVTAIENDEVTGCTVTVDLGDGYEAVYGQLKELNFAVGDYVEAGHVIGYVSEPTKYFSVEGSNLYFELRKDGAPIDPVEFFS